MAFSTGMLPQLYKCNRAAAKTVDKTFQLVKNNCFSSTIEEFLAVLRAEYQCLGITCEDVGGLWDDKDGVEPGEYYAGAEPCVTEYGPYLAVDWEDFDYGIDDEIEDDDDIEDDMDDTFDDDLFFDNDIDDDFFDGEIAEDDIDDDNDNFPNVDIDDVS